MNRIDSTQAAVLQAFVKRLIDTVPNLTTSTCFLSVYPDPPSALASNLWVTVSVWSGTFPEEFQAGAGEHQCTEESGVLVKAFSRMKTDRNAQDVNALIDEARGLLTLKEQLLRALVGQDLQFERNLMLRNLVMAKSASAPEKSPNFDGFAEISVLFSVTFDHDLTS